MTQQHTVWVSRDEDGGFSVWNRHPRSYHHRTSGQYWSTKEGGPFDFVEEDFGFIFGFTPTPGECRKVTITSEVVS